MRSICIRLSECIIKRLEQIREMTGMPVSGQINLILSGYRIVRIDDGSEVLSTTLFRSGVI
mgnify:CR=1 FL=1